jgi:tetratricopeptide (TPR) repeat protein/tRNA A-37 threonylcarbamoyl transferase component Bud32
VAEVGRGGQGIVYRARQRGVGRDVALKRMIAGSFATEPARRRFEREVEAAATLRHVGVVTVYGLEMIGAEPVLAMEWVDGVPITRWARPGGAPPRSQRAILDVFLQVCDAVQHAHRHGVIHRDLKPSNILVDRDGRPRVLDFGMAKLAEEHRSERVSLTESGAFAGTIAYAAPEQLMDATSLDTRCDVYALGGVLHELLAGQPLYPRDLPMPQLVDAILRSDPPAPSRRNPEVSRELDHVVQTAMARELDHRYPSIEAFAADVRRFLAGEPVLAHPPSTLYRLRKLVLRHRVASGLIALVVMLLVGFLVTTLRHAAELTRERDLALAAGRREQDARAHAEREREDAQTTLGFLVEDVLGSVDATKERRSLTVSSAIDAARERVSSRFSGRPRLEASVRGSIATAYLALGRHADAEREIRRSIEIRRGDPDSLPGDLANALVVLSRALSMQGKVDEAGKSLEEAHAILSRLGLAASTLLAVVVDDLALLSRDRGDLESAVRYSREAVAVQIGHCGPRTTSVAQARQNLAAFLMQLGRTSEARAELLEALVILDRDALAPGLDALLTNLGWLQVLEGSLVEGIASLRRAAAICDEQYGDHPETARTLSVLSQALLRAGLHEEAEETARRSVGMLKRASPAPRRDLAVALGALARSAAARGSTREAVESMQEAASVLDATGNSEEAAQARTEIESFRQRASSRPSEPK